MIFLLHNIGTESTSNYNTREQVMRQEGVLTFDGVYESVYYNADVLEGRTVLLFITGSYVGKDNSFDEGQPPERFCSWEQLIELEQAYNVTFGWHTWTHRRLTELSDEEVWSEITPPRWLNVSKFAYPYGSHDARIMGIVSQMYEEAYSVGRQSRGGPYSIRRHHLR